MRRLLFSFLFVFVAISGWAQAPVTTTDYVSKFFDTNGTPTNSLIFDNGTYVGIGTTTPLYNLHVTSLVDPAAIAVQGIGHVGANFIGLRAEGAPGSLSHVLANDNLFTLQGRGYGSTAWSSGSRAYLKMFANEDWTDTVQSTYITFGTVPAGSKNIAERLRIDNAGRVGINTTTPGALLEVNGSALIDGPITVAGQIQSTSGGFKFPDGTLLTTAGLVVNSPLTGSGTASNPLGLNLSVTPPLSGGNNGTPVALTGIVGALNGGTGLSYVGNGFLRGNGGSLSYSSIGYGDLPSLNGVYVDLVSPQTIGGNKVFSSQASFNVGTGGTNAVMAEADGTGSFAVQGTTNATDSQASGVLGTAMNNGTSSARGVSGIAYGSSGIGVIGIGNGISSTGVSGIAEGSTATAVTAWASTGTGIRAYTGGATSPAAYITSGAVGGTILAANYAPGGNNPQTGFRVMTSGSGYPVVQMPAWGTPTSSTPVSSSYLNFQAGVVDNTNAVHNPKLLWRADPVNNGTASNYNAKLVFYSGMDSIPATATGLSINADGTINFASNQTFSAGGGLTGVTAGTGLTGGGTSGNVTLNVDYGQVQPLLSGLNGVGCGTGNAVSAISTTGAVTCVNLTTGGGPAYLPLSTGAQVTGNISVVPPTTGASSLYAVTAVQNQQGASMGNGGGGGSPTAAWFATVPAAVVGTATDQSGNVATGMFAQGTGPGDLALAALSVGTLPTIFAWNNNTSTTGSDNGPSPDAIDAQTSAGYGDVFHGEATAAAGTSPTCQNNCTDLTVFKAEADATSGVTNLFYGDASSPYANGIQLNFGTALTTDCPQGTNCPSVFDAQGQNGNFNIDGAFNVSTTGSISANGANFTGGTVSADTINANAVNVINASFSGTLTASSVNINGTLNANGANINGTLNANGANIPGPLTTNSASIIDLNAGNATFGPGAVLVNNGMTINGNLNVNGNVNKSSGNFKIDHPLDPANKYLYHSFVESPDMMNIYNGIIVLDRRGVAWVELPNYFEVLNQDFRYQLTAIGAPGPNLYIAKEISGNRFRIAGGKPGMKVSWQVTGVRHDEWANAHRTQVEVEKTGKERGTYLHPELFPEKTALAQKK